MALWRTSEIIEPGRSFASVYFIRAAFITLYRIMQADFGNIWLFVGLSLLSGLSSLLKTTTVGIRVGTSYRVFEQKTPVHACGVFLRPDSTSAFSRRNANYFACFF
jgi:hypothetical protein